MNTWPSFSFRDYTTTTAYLSLNYASPFYNLDSALHVGRYLAKDLGATFEVRRTFSNGFSVGGFFTKTDIPPEKFGEGSFDKGLFFRISFNGFIRKNTRGAYATILRPLDRDGGRRLEDFSGSIWFSRRGYRYDALQETAIRALP